MIHADGKQADGRAYAMMGGLFIATLLTLLFLPALYAAWYRVPPPEALPAEPYVGLLYFRLPTG